MHILTSAATPWSTSGLSATWERSIQLSCNVWRVTSSCSSWSASVSPMLVACDLWQHADRVGSSDTRLSRGCRALSEDYVCPQAALLFISSLMIRGGLATMPSTVVQGKHMQYGCACLMDVLVLWMCLSYDCACLMACLMDVLVYRLLHRLLDIQGAVTRHKHKQSIFSIIIT